MVASSYDDDRGKGAMYVFTRSGTTWSQQARLQASIAERGDSFGVAISLSNDGNTLAVGSHDEDCLATGVNPKACDNDQPSDTSAGAAVVFVRTGSTWTEQALLKASNTGRGDTFGSRIAVSGDGNTVAVSAPLEDGSAHRPRHADAARRVAGWAITWFHASRNDRPAVTHTSRPNAGTRSRRAAGAADSYADRSNSTSESDP